jgi:hypothetical protein
MPTVRADHPEEIQKWMAYWIESDIDKLWSIFSAGKGYEVWAQVEIADYLNNVANLFAWVEQEEPIYSTDPATPRQQRRVDFVISDDDKKLQHVIELKCRREKQTADDFRTELYNDWTKIQDELKQDYRYARRWVIGINPGGTTPDTNWSQSSISPALFARTYQPV